MITLKQKKMIVMNLKEKQCNGAHIINTKDFTLSALHVIIKGSIAENRCVSLLFSQWVAKNQVRRRGGGRVSKKKFIFMASKAQNELH